MANISAGQTTVSQVARLLGVLHQPVRIQILAVLAGQPACVCHLEAVLGLRQASISQHLMVLRQAGLVVPNRAGRNVFYQISAPEIPALLALAAQAAGRPVEDLTRLAGRPVEGCPCPQCSAALGQLAGACTASAAPGSALPLDTH